MDSANMGNNIVDEICDNMEVDLKVKVELELIDVNSETQDLDNQSLGCSSNSSSSQNECTAFPFKSDSTAVNETESKYLEDQANSKKLLEDSEIRLNKLQAALQQKDEVIQAQEKDNNILEKEKTMLKRELDLSIREKESAVIRYATVEKNVLDIKTLKDTMERKFKDCQKDVEFLNGKVKAMSSEKIRICNMLDAKCHELKANQKDCEKIKQDFTSLEMKSKWNLVKLKQEMDLKLAAEKRVEELNMELLKANDIIKQKTEVQTEKSNVTEEQIMEQQATLILLKHGNEEKERKIETLENRILTSISEISEMQFKLGFILKERDSLSIEVESNKLENNDLQITLDKEVLKVAELQSKVNELETLKTQFSIEKEILLRTKLELDTLRTNYDEQTNELEKLRMRESELLQFNKDLSERTAKLQNEISLYNSKSVALCLENENVKKEKKYYEDKIKELETQLNMEVTQKNDERILLTKHISEKTKLCENLQKKLEHSLGDIDAIKKKHSQTIKELNRELVQLRKKCEQMGTINPHIENGLDKYVTIKKESPSPHTSDTDSQAADIPPISDIPNIQIQEPSKKTLIERIVRLQHANNRQSEKIDFLENHSANLTNDLQKKTKLVQYYMLRDQSGALSSTKSDRNKAELVKYGGIMSAIYSGIKGNTTTDMTLDLSLEINRKLQAVLEDTLLKNITLKENLDTLGLEIDKLTRQLSSMPAMTTSK